ncbi:MAG: TATA box-binding protein [Thermoprotei archaeon]|nr:MAG: TATA box-binding protein [Thermoprotei archaeon]
MVNGRSIGDFERIGTHSHIKGLGIKDGVPQYVGDGLVGQVEARKAAWIIVNIIKSGKMAGKAILLAGPPGTGKTAIAVAIAKELGGDTPFMALSGSEVYSTEMKKTEVLMQAMRKTIGVRIREFRRVYEGMVAKMEIKFDKHPYNPWQQIPVGGKITLKTKSEEKTFSIDSSLVQELLSKGVSEGDVVWIDEESGRVHKVGRAKSSEVQYDISSERVVDIPSGTILKEKEFIHTVTLHDLDVMQSQSRGLFSLLFGGLSEREISPEVRQRVDEIVKQWVDEGKAELLPGVLFIDDVHMLDIECFSFLSRAIESELSPILILATNRGITRIKGTDIVAPHGIPYDLLDRLLIIRTKPYSREEILEILKIRAKEEKVKLSDDALQKLADIGHTHSLRYAVQLLTPSSLIAREKGKEEVGAAEVEEAAKYFISIKESSQYLKSLEEQFLK